MGETTGISWTDHTFNAWIGCTKVSPGCAHCYAETQNKVYGWNPAGWGKGAPRKRTSEANWKKPLTWAKQAMQEGVIRRVFCSSLADVFDNEVDPEWRKDLFDLIDTTGKIGGLEWLLLTKRPINLYSMLPAMWMANPPRYVRIGTTTENQEYADMRITHLLDLWGGKNFLSVEPMLGPITFRNSMTKRRCNYCHDECADNQFVCELCGSSDIRDFRTLDWVIVGGESGPKCRPMELDWARAVRDQCVVADVPFFFKQIGGHPDKRHNPEGWPEDLRVQEFPKR